MNPETPTLTRSQLRCLCDDQAASPKSRLDAAGMLLDHFGGSARNLRFARRVARKFEKYVATSPRTQTQVRWWSEKLKARLERISEAETLPPEDPDDNETDSALPEDEPSTPTRKPIIGNTELLPPGAEDSFWDSPFRGSSRRQLFLLAWRLDPTLTHSETVAALSTDPARLESNTLRLQLWARSREQLDQQFERDSEMIRAELTARGFEDTDAGRNELTRQILASGEPLHQFEKPSPALDFNGTGLPILIRSKTGQLIDAIDFISKWPHMRQRHNPL